MIELTIALGAGLISFLSPCVLPLIPGYISYISGSSLKFCEIAEGNADIYPRFGPTSEWDIAAGHIILEEAGGVIKDIDGNQILYNNKETLINPEFIATNNLKLI